MADWSKELSISNPQDVNNPTDGANQIRIAKEALVERLAVEHKLSAGAVGDNLTDGEHKKVTLNEQSDPSSVAANTGIIYTKEASAKAELHFKDEGGNVGQLTSVGKIGHGTLGIIADDAVAEDSIKDDAVTENKIKDAVVTDAKLNLTQYAGAESVIMPNGMIFKGGITASIAGVTSGSVVFGAAFPNALLSIVITTVKAGAQGTAAGIYISVQSITGFTMYNYNLFAAEFNWIAIGY